MEKLSLEQLKELYLNNEKKSKELLLENSLIKMELNFRAKTNYESSELISQEAINSYLIYSSEKSYFLNLNGLKWFAENKKDDKKCQPYFHELNSINNILSIDKKSNNALPKDTAESLQIILKKYGFRFYLNKESLEICISHEENNGYGERNESKWKKVPVFDTIKI